MNSAPALATLEQLDPGDHDGRLDPAARFHCRALSCSLRVGTCLLRQAVSRRQRTRQASRGQGGDFPSCTEACLQGAENRATVGGGALSWRGRGPGGRFDAGPPARSLRAQLEARRRVQVVGLMDPVPSMDEPPAESEEHLPPAGE